MEDKYLTTYFSQRILPHEFSHSNVEPALVASDSYRSTCCSIPISMLMCQQYIIFVNVKYAEGREIDAVDPQIKTLFYFSFTITT